MKCLFLAGSANPHSVSVMIAKRFIEILKQVCDQEIETNIISLQNKHVELCKGCECCFTRGVCPLDTDDDLVKIIKIELMKADLVVFISPIYFGNVSGGIKTIFDRLSYWSHLMPLYGKMGVGIVVSDGNSYSVGLQYLSVVMESLGLSVIDNISLLRTTAANSTALNSVLSVLAESILRIKNGGELPVSIRQKMLYESLSKRIQSRGSGAEYDYWDKRGLFNYHSFSELISKTRL